MRLKRFKYEKNSPLKSCYIKLSNIWAAIASAYSMEVSAAELEASSIIIANAAKSIHADTAEQLQGQYWAHNFWTIPSSEVWS